MAYWSPPGCGRAVDRVGVLGVDDHQGVEGLELGHVLFHLLRVQVGELVHAGVQQEALEAEHALVVQRAQVRLLPGTAPPQKPTSTNAWSPATSRLSLRPSTVVVGGMEFSGMSRIVVTPPAAAARVAEAKPSHSVRPGSLTWTWVSTRPGIRVSSSASSITSAPAQPVAERLDGDDLPAAHAHFARGDAGGGEDALAPDDEVKAFFRH